MDLNIGILWLLSIITAVYEQLASIFDISYSYLAETICVCILVVLIIIVFIATFVKAFRSINSPSTQAAAGISLQKKQFRLTMVFFAMIMVFISIYIRMTV